MRILVKSIQWYKLIAIVCVPISLIAAIQLNSNVLLIAASMVVGMYGSIMILINDKKSIIGWCLFVYFWPYLGFSILSQLFLKH